MLSYKAMLLITIQNQRSSQRKWKRLKNRPVCQTSVLRGHVTAKNSSKQLQPDNKITWRYLQSSLLIFNETVSIGFIKTISCKVILITVLWLLNEMTISELHCTLCQGFTTRRTQRTVCSWRSLVTGSLSGLVMLVYEVQHVTFGQFLRVHSGLRIMNYNPIHPGPEEPLGVAYAARKKNCQYFPWNSKNSLNAV